MCGQKALLGKTRCSNCRKRNTALFSVKRENSRQNGLCIQCHKEKTYATLDSCLTCNMKAKAYIHLKDRSRYEELIEKLESQLYLCPYTGEQLIIGVNASVDHIYPKKRFPELAHDINNLEWVHSRINNMKHDFTKDEFLAMVRNIYKNTEGVE